VVVGNPPWERIKLQEQEFFAGTPVAEAANAAARTRLIREWAGKEPGSYERRWIDRYETAKRLAEASGVFFTSPKDEDPTKLPAGVRAAPTRRYPWTGRGDVNTYALFAEHFLNLTREGGRAGVIVPTGIATDATTAPFFGHLVSGQRLAALTDFENSAPLFPGVHRSFKFCLLTIGSGVTAADFAFFLTDPTQLEDARRRFTLSPQEIARINPNTKTAPVFRSCRDAELTASIYNRVPTFSVEGSWQPDFFKKMFDFGVHRDLLHFSTTCPGPEFDALYEAKMIDYFNHRYSTYGGVSDADFNAGAARHMSDKELEDASIEIHPRCWVKRSDFAARMADRDWQRDWFLSMRDVTNATNERTAIFSLRPKLPSNDKLPTIFVRTQPNEVAALYANLAALTLDYVARQKVGGTNLASFIVDQFPILPPSTYSEADLAFIVPRVLELTYTSHSMAPFARDLGYQGRARRLVRARLWLDPRRAALRSRSYRRHGVGLP
jgi:hypothetical protein